MILRNQILNFFLDTVNKIKEMIGSIEMPVTDTTCTSNFVKISLGLQK
jgi:hypothetical protein